MPTQTPRGASAAAAAMLGFVCLCAAPARADILLTSATASSSSNMELFGPAVTIEVPSGTANSYGTQVVGQPIISGTGGGAILNTWAAVSQVSGTTKTISMSWRVRTLNESFPWEPGGNPTQPPMNLAGLDFGLASDVLDLTGFAPGEVFVLQMLYDDTLFDEDTEVAAGCVHVNWLNPDTGIWENAVLGNLDNDPNALTYYNGSWADAGSTMLVGSWGVDKVANVSWAVLDHNSYFAVVPEPSAAWLAVCGVACAARLARRRRA